MKSLLRLLGSLCALGCALLGALGAHAQEPVRIRVKGSDAIGAQLGPALARAFEQSRPGVAVQWQSLGSGSGFLGLLDGSAELGAASRPVQPEELELARRLGVRLHEYVIGFDALCAIVHPSNPLRELDREQLARLFSGAVRNWKELGGQDRRVETVELPAYSGASALWRERIAPRGPADPPPSPDWARFVEDGADAVSAVARSPRAIGYASLGQIGKAQVRALAVAMPGGSAVAPNPQTVRDGSYPLHRALYLYTRGEPHGALRELIEFALAPAGQQLLASQGLLPLDLPAALPAEPARAAAQPAIEPPLRIRFSVGSVRLSGSDQRELDALVPPLLAGTHSALIRGHADGVQPDPKNADYALQRAEVIAEYLRSKGVAPERLVTSGLGESEPVDSNESAEGRRANRRVDLHLVPEPDPSASTPPAPAVPSPS